MKDADKYSEWYLAAEVTERIQQRAKSTGLLSEQDDSKIYTGNTDTVYMQIRY